jgi:hypothetical protein
MTLPVSNTGTSEEQAHPPLSVEHYRGRAYRDGFVILLIAAIAYLILIRIDLANVIALGMHQVRTWELAAIFVVPLFSLAGSFVFILRRRAELLEEIAERKKLQEEQDCLISQLEQALANIRTLSELLPICGWCKKIRDDKGYWTELEAYLQSHTNTRFTHGICPECAASFRSAPGTKSQ